MTEQDEIERRWILQPDFEWPEGVESRLYDISQQVLLHPDEDLGAVERVRHRKHHGTDEVELTHTVKYPTGVMGVRKESERVISFQDYAKLRVRAHPEQNRIFKIRRVFGFEGRTFELDEFLEPLVARGLLILECELPDLEAPLTLPPWLKVVREVTQEPGWTNAEISHKGWTPPVAF